jgi:hypothetical protein
MAQCAVFDGQAIGPSSDGPVEIEEENTGRVADPSAISCPWIGGS